MRTVFRADDKSEDGFLFLSDAFIRQLVGPASKIKEKRRLEALTSLYMLTNAALFTAWENGRVRALRSGRITLCTWSEREERTPGRERSHASAVRSVNKGGRHPAVRIMDVTSVLQEACPCHSSAAGCHSSRS